jgi:naphthalene 1,2-dioxygenase system ferredoxin subunit
MTLDPSWTDVASTGDLWDDAGVSVIVHDRDLALFKVGDTVYATDNLCTHGDARLCEGFVEGHEVECPLHQGRFDLRTGAPTCAPANTAIRTYPVRIDGYRVWVQLEP